MDSYLRRLFIVPEGPSSQQLTCSIFLIGFLGCAREIELVRLGWEGMWQKQEKLWEGGRVRARGWARVGHLKPQLYPQVSEELETRVE